MELNTILSKMKHRSPSILGSESLSKYSILLPLIQKADGIHVLFEVRSLELRRQPGEVCFPGGRIDLKDSTAENAAIRETVEELGLEADDISSVFPLDHLVSPFGMIIFPFVGFIHNPEQIKPNPSEVGEIFTVPLSFFCRNKPEIFRVNFKAEPEEDFPYHLVLGGANYKWQTRQMEEYFFTYEKRVIWGLTARILAHFIEIVR
jgi:peroxisomal coenzyme A diphosphatase NUDT7